jgi:flagellin-specific chaperone FliS
MAGKSGLKSGPGETQANQPKTGPKTGPEARDELKKGMEILDPLMQKLNDALKQIGESLAAIFEMDYKKWFTKDGKFDFNKFHEDFKNKVKPLNDKDLADMRINENEMNRSSNNNGQWIYSVIGMPAVFQEIIKKATADNPDQAKTGFPDDFGSKCLMMQFRQKNNGFPLPDAILNALKNSGKTNDKNEPLRQLHKNDLMFYKDGAKVYAGVIRGFNSPTKKVQLMVNGAAKDVDLNNCVYGVYLKNNTTALQDAGAAKPAQTVPAKPQQ